MGRRVATDTSCGGQRVNGNASGDVADGLHTFIATAALFFPGAGLMRVPVLEPCQFPSRRRVPPQSSPKRGGAAGAFSASEAMVAAFPVLPLPLAPLAP